MFLTALSQRTSRMRIGATVYVLPMYEPLRLAEEIAVLDQLSGGRVDVGVGSGVQPWELEYFGIPAAEARERYGRALPALLAAWRDGILVNPEHPERPAATLAALPVQRPYPPIWYVSSNEKTAAWAGANAVHFIGRWNAGAFIEAARAYWAAWRTGAGDTSRINAHLETLPHVGLSLSVLIGATDASARDRYLQAQSLFYERVSRLGREHGQTDPFHAFSPQHMLDNGIAVVGTADTVAEQLIAMLEQTDVNLLQSQLVFGDLSFGEAQANLRAFAGIMPRIRAAAEESGSRAGRMAMGTVAAAAAEG
jgi:alkanesulfonate monooxygenase SsuD/methylene tetrahydromethanopterin reductase-like flavin-dependent oxidoreductase (luciferase family)